MDAQPATRQTAKILTISPKAARAYRQQIERGLGDDPRVAAKGRVILRVLLGPIQMCPVQDGSRWAQYHTRPAALIKRAVEASVELSGSGARALYVSKIPGVPSVIGDPSDCRVPVCALPCMPIFDLNDNRFDGSFDNRTNLIDRFR